MIDVAFQLNCLMSDLSSWVTKLIGKTKMITGLFILI